MYHCRGDHEEGCAQRQHCREPELHRLGVADALLGNFRTYSEGADDPLGFFRFTQYAAFVSDNWKVTPNLSLEYGLRYELSSPTYTQGNNRSREPACGAGICRGRARHNQHDRSQPRDSPTAELQRECPA